VLYLMEIERLSLEEVGRILYHESGLKGVSGISPDPRDLLAVEARAPRARLALDLYVRRIVREIGALTAVLGGLDMLVFTAGIGEHSVELRRRICEGLAWLGVALDPEANAAQATTLSTPDSAVRVAMEPTNEEWIAARHALDLLG
jgi:acetate kinase